ncbi:MAG: type II toxin-antitoxin system Phd/YefM family antitoxin [Pseudomonadota bacterium]
MDFVTARELRAESARVWEKLEAGEEIVITRNGKPFAVLVHTEPQDLEATLRALRAERFASNVRRMQRQAVEQGLDKLTMDEIDAEIEATRKERRGRDAGRR